MDSLKLGSIITWYEMFAAPKPQSFVKDLNNGMVAYGSSYLGKDSYSFFLKKCFQGQIYRSSFNDCKGTGDASNNYGAQLLQFCNKNDNSCIREVPYYDLSGFGNSEAYASCNSEKLDYSGMKAKNKWKLPTPYELYFIIKYSNNINYFPDVPRDLFFWTAVTDTSLNAIYTSFNLMKEPVYTVKDVQTNRRYVLCYFQNF
ncbi:MAG TPA: hypothetical protein PKN56_22020 [Leptospiraceae bacterium]|nr:hypothetical protein [Leptospiraceae bacterium]